MGEQQKLHQTNKRPNETTFLRVTPNKQGLPPHKTLSRL